MRETLALQDASYYHYLNQSGCTRVDGMNDAEEYKDVVVRWKPHPSPPTEFCSLSHTKQRAMDTMGFTAEEKSEIFRILAAILYLGNIQFADDDKEQAYITNQDCIEMFAYLIQSDSESVKRALLFRTISTGTQGRSARVSTYGVPQNALGVRFTLYPLAQPKYELTTPFSQPSGHLFSRCLSQGYLLSLVWLHYRPRQSSVDMEWKRVLDCVGYLGYLRFRNFRCSSIHSTTNYFFESSWFWFPFV